MGLELSVKAEDYLWPLMTNRKHFQLSVQCFAYLFGNDNSKDFPNLKLHELSGPFNNFYCGRRQKLSL
jgi:hypothetical protein